MPSDDDLLSDWQDARGRFAPAISELQRAALIPALRAWWTRKHNPLPIEHCPVCGVKARGPHQMRQKAAA